MTDIPWNAQAHLIRRSGVGETAEGSGTLHQLVGAALEMSSEQQKGLLLRASGRDWTREFDEAAIRELAARPEFTGAAGFFDTAERSELDEAEADAPDDTLIEAGVSGATQG